MSNEQQTDQTPAPKAVSAVRATPMQNGMNFMPQSFGELMEWAKIVCASGFVPKQYTDNPGGVLVAVQMGAEVGLGPMAALQNIAVINGRPQVWGDAGLAIVKTHPDYNGIKETWDKEKKEARCVLKRVGEEDVDVSFGWEDAVTANLVGKDGPWQTNPKRMCQMRARWFAMRDQFPDALRGIGGAEEAQDHEPLKPAPAVVDRPRSLDDVVARAKPALPPKSLDDVVVRHEAAKQVAPVPARADDQPPPPTDADAPAIAQANPRARKAGF